MRLIDESVIEGGHLTPEERIALQAEEIKQLWQENEQLRAQVATHVGLLQRASIALYDLMYTLDFYMKESCIVPNDMHKRHIRQGEQTLAAIDKAIGGGDVDKG